MEDRYYVVAVISGPEDDPDDPFNPKCYPETYEDAMQVARPWAEQGYDVVITTRRYMDESKEE